MGRLPKNGIRKSLYSDTNLLKTRHRHADTKYRSNVQYLYSKLKEMSQNKAAKDCILNVTLVHIQSLESEIIKKVGNDEMKSYQNDFINFLHNEEALWKIKDAVKWWRKVEETLNSRDLVDDENEEFEDSCQSNGLNLQQKNISSNAECPRWSSCCNKKSTLSGTFDGISPRSTKSKRRLLNHVSDISESYNAIPCFSKENASNLCEEEPDSLLLIEEQNCFSNGISAEILQFENSLF